MVRTDAGSGLLGGWDWLAWGVYAGGEICWQNLRGGGKKWAQEILINRSI
jgi:hypothetical protein